MTRYPEMNIRNLANYTSWQVTRESLERLLDQGTTATAVDGSCMYRTDDGRRCAVGVFINPEDYFEEMEGATSSRLLRGLSEKWGLNHNRPDIVRTLAALQSVHDNAARAARLRHRPSPLHEGLLLAALMFQPEVADVLRLVIDERGLAVAP